MLPLTGTVPEAVIYLVADVSTERVAGGPDPIDTDPWSRYVEGAVRPNPFGTSPGGILGGGVHETGHLPPRLPFDTCKEFVKWLSDFVTDVMIEAHVKRQRPAVTAAHLGGALIQIAYLGYESHIHNDYKGFKSDLIDAGKDSPAGQQGAGVYGHLLFGAGATLWSKSDPRGWAAFQANRLKDWAQGAGGNPQYQSERAGNIAGKAVGNHIWDYLGGKPSQNDLINKLNTLLCN